MLLCSSRASVVSTVCEDVFGFAQRVHIPSLRTAQHAALAHLAATAPSKLNPREGCLHRWRVLLVNFKLNVGSMSKDVRVLLRKDLHHSVFVASTVVCVATWSWLSSTNRQIAFSLVELHERLNSAKFFWVFRHIENPIVVSAILIDGVIGHGGANVEAEHVPQPFHCKGGILDRCGECEQIFRLVCVMSVRLVMRG